MPDTLCRLAIQVSGPVASTVVDVVLPADCPVGVLIPPVVDVALGDRQPASDPQRWHLVRVGGDRLDTSLTLRQNAVRDGDMILLAAAAVPVPARRSGDPSGVVAGAALQAPGAPLHGGAAVAGIAVTGVSAAALTWSGSTSGTSAHLWTAAALSAGAAAVAIAAGRSAPLPAVTSSLAAVVFATVTGVLAMPGAPWAPTILLAASAACAISILLLRMASRGTTTLTTLTVLTGTVALVGAIGVIAAVPFDGAGAMLTVLSLGGLSAAPTLTVAVAGLGPSRPDVGSRRAAVAHRMLTGLVTGWSCAAVLGVAAVAGHPRAAPAVAALFCADVALLLLLRQRTHVDARRRMALSSAGVGAALAAATVVVRGAPEHAHWWCAALVTVAMAALHRRVGAAPANPVVRRVVQVIEYLALAAVVPLAAWVTGVYDVVRDLALP